LKLLPWLNALNAANLSPLKADVIFVKPVDGVSAVNMGYELNKYTHITYKEVDEIIHKEYAR
jgi:hypothetical protein